MNDSRAGILLIATGFIIHVLFFGFLLNYNLINLEFQDSFNSTATETGIPGSVAIGLLNLMTPLTTIFFKFTSHRTVVAVGVVLCGASLIASAFVSHIHVLIFSYGIIYGVGISFIHIPTLHLLVYYYSGKRYNQSCVAVVTGIGAGISLSSLLLEHSFSEYGLKKTLLVYGACEICIGLLLCMAMVMPAKNINDNNDNINDSYESVSPKELDNYDVHKHVESDIMPETSTYENNRNCHGTLTRSNNSTDIQLPNNQNDDLDVTPTKLLDTPTSFAVDADSIPRLTCSMTDELPVTEKPIGNTSEEDLFISKVDDNLLLQPGKGRPTNPDKEAHTYDVHIDTPEAEETSRTFLVEMIKSVDFWLCQPMYFLHYLAITFSFVSLGNFMDGKGMTSEAIARILSLMGFADLATRVLYVVVAYRLPFSTCNIFAAASSMCVLISILLSLNLSNDLISVLLIGLGFSRAILLMFAFPVCVEVFGKQKSAESMSAAYFFIGIGCLLSQPLSDTVYDSSDSYDGVLHLCAALYAVPAVSFWLIVFKRRRNKQTDYKKHIEPADVALRAETAL